MPELDDSGRPLDEAGIKTWWERWGLDHAEAQRRRREAYILQRAETMEVMNAKSRSTTPPPRLP
jgi:hypothetical protein